MLKGEKALQVLRQAGLFFYDGPEDLEEGEDPRFAQMLNLNDVWGWACADGEYVPDDEVDALYRLFHKYGWCGVLYWVSVRRDNCQSEFPEMNRKIEFVRNEERLIQSEPSRSKRAYAKVRYTIGVPESEASQS